MSLNLLTKPDELLQFKDSLMSKHSVKDFVEAILFVQPMSHPKHKTHEVTTSMALQAQTESVMRGLELYRNEKSLI